MEPLRTEDCPLRCGWRTPLQVLQLELNPARERLQPATERVREHLTAEHREELQLMLAGADGGRGVPRLCSVTQHVDARTLLDAGDVVLGVLVPKLRGQLAAELARLNLRPLDPWPAVQVYRYAWTSEQEWATRMMNGTPPGMRELTPEELRAGRTADLYRLELRTDAVQDTRPVVAL